MKKKYYERYQNMTEQDRYKNYLSLDLDLVIGGKPELLFELLSALDFDNNEPSLLLRRIVEELEIELGIE